MCQLWGVLPYLVPTANRGDQSATKGKTNTWVMPSHLTLTFQVEGGAKILLRDSTTPTEID